MGLLGAAIAMSVPDFRRGYTRLSTATVGITFLSPVFFPLGDLWPAAQIIAWASPLTHMAELLRAIFAGAAGPIQHWLALIVLAPGLATLVARRLTWRVSIMLEADICIGAVEEALARHGTPEILNTDQGSQFTSTEFIKVLAARETKISMDGKGAWRDNVFVERLWRTIKYEKVYLRAHASVSEACAGIMPALATGVVGALFGNFSEAYTIADRTGLAMVRDVYSQPGFVRWYVRRRVGGALTNPEAVKALVLGVDPT